MLKRVSCLYTPYFAFMRPLSLLLFVLLLCFACSDDELPAEDFLHGSWIEAEGHIPGGSSTLYFYDDKLTTRRWDGEVYHQTIFTVKLTDKVQEDLGRLLEVRWVEDPSQLMHLYISGEEDEAEITFFSFYPAAGEMPNQTVFVRPKR